MLGSSLFAPFIGNLNASALRILSGEIVATGDNAHVRKRKSVTLVIMLAVVITGLCIYLSRSREPGYQGKSLSQWLRQSARSEENDIGGAGTVSGKAAVRQIGTNAIPSLLAMLKRKSSPFALKMIALAQRHELPRSIFAPNVAEDENYLAQRGFHYLGADASNAAPELVRIYHQNISETSQNCALESLFFVSPPQSHALLNEALTNRFESVRLTALFHLTPTNQPDVAVPILVKGLSDPSSLVEQMSAFRLRKFGTNALPAVPALVRLATASSALGFNFGPALAANRTLCLLDPQTAAKVLTNGFYTYERFTNDLALAKARDEAQKNGPAAKSDFSRHRPPPTQTNK